MSEDHLLVSIITVVRDDAAGLERTMDSVAAQDYPCIDYVVVDGASMDGTVSVIERRRSEVSRWLSEPDGGIYEAMNKGLAAASGDVIGFLNADDYYVDVHVLERVVAAFDEGLLDAVFGDVAYVSDRAPGRVVRRYRSDRFRPDRLAWGWMPAHPGLFVRRAMFERVGPFSTAYRIAGDFEWIARAFSGPDLRYRYLPSLLVYMRTGGISTGGWRNTVLLNREVMRACRENGIPTNWLKLLSKYPAKMLEFFAR